MLDSSTRPVMDGVLQPLVAGKGADHEALFAAAPGDRSRACQSPQGMVISSAQRLRGLGEQRGENDSADSWPGATNSGIFRKVSSTVVASRRRMRWSLRMRAIVFSDTFAAAAGVDTCCQSARNQSSATSSVNSVACG